MDQKGKPLIDISEDLLANGDNKHNVIFKRKMRGLMSTIKKSKEPFIIF